MNKSKLYILIGLGAWILISGFCFFAGYQTGYQKGVASVATSTISLNAYLAGAVDAVNSVHSIGIASTTASLEKFVNGLNTQNK